MHLFGSKAASARPGRRARSALEVPAKGLVVRIPQDLPQDQVGPFQETMAFDGRNLHLKEPLAHRTYSKAA